MTEILRKKEINPLIVPTFGVVLFNNNNNVLLVKHSQSAAHKTGLYGIPAGIAYAGETPIQTAVRECFEETGLRLLPSNLKEYPNNFAVAEIQRKKDRKKFSITAYVGSVFSPNTDLTDLTETEQGTPEWIPIGQLSQLDHQGLLLPNMQAIIRNAEIFNWNNFHK